MLTNRLANGRTAGTGRIGAELGAGSLIVGWGRVERMVKTTTTVKVWRKVETVRRGKKRVTIGDPRTYLLHERVEGTKYRSASDMPAGPVHLEPGREARDRVPGGRINGRGVGESARDRHASMMANVSY